MVLTLKPHARGRTLAALLVSAMPVNGLRVALYRVLLGFEFGPGARVGLLTVIACDGFRAGAGVQIGRSNRFVGPFTAEIGEKAIIGRFNSFNCGPSAASPDKAHMRYARRLVIGERALVNDNHYFDVYGAVEIGARTWIAGAGSQFWTHGASVQDRDIRIGEDCYIGSAVRFAPGAGVANRCVLGLGSVVVSQMPESNAVLAGFPAKKIRDIDPDDDRQFRL